MSTTYAARALYTAEARRSGDWWAVRIPGVDGAFTQARRIDQIEAMARDVIALMLDVPEDSFDLDVHVDLPPEAEEGVRRLQKARQEAYDAQAGLTAAAGSAAQILVRDLGLTVRDAGRILGVSHQRVDQLLHRGP